ncbi:MAG: glucuronyl hydrolase, partial [Tannerella sp.]|nr:glucuronyl hydrolase [Tannerella sp.]
TNGNFLLKHSVGSLPHNSEVDVPLTYADYYYIEALLRYRDLPDKTGKK